MISVVSAEDIEAIKALKARYFRLMDTKQWDEFAEIFAEDLEFEAPDDARAPIVRGRDRFVSDVSTILEGATTVHHGHMPEIELTGPDTARGTWSMEDIVQFADGSGIHGYGHYTEEYARVDGQWRIRRMVLTRLRRDALG